MITSKFIIHLEIATLRAECTNGDQFNPGSGCSQVVNPGLSHTKNNKLVDYGAYEISFNPQVIFGKTIQG